MKQKLIQLKGEIDHSTIRIEEINTLLPIMDTTTRHKINKAIKDFINTISNQT